MGEGTERDMHRDDERDAERGKDRGKGLVSLPLPSPRMKLLGTAGTLTAPRAMGMPVSSP